MDNVIDFNKALKDKEGAWYEEGIALVNSIDPDTASRIVTFLLTYVTTEVKVGLGLLDTEDDPGELKFFNKIADIFEKAAGGCYFCSKTIDPNADEFSKDTRACPACALKLANFVQALGINPGTVFKGMKHREVQKARVIHNLTLANMDTPITKH
ncbi:MAG: hypothetical protein KKC46_02340 [Proteobacteria bacterium]|nr:hypothetical protein [Pseudomonadota bacterium]